MPNSCQVQVKFCQPPADLARYFNVFYVADITVLEGGYGNGTVTDYLHPEWGNLRLLSNRVVQAVSEAEPGPQHVVADTDFIATGPSARAVRFTVRSTRLWGIGFLPLGWAKFVRAPAGGMTNAVMDGNTHPSMAGLTPLAAGLFRPEPDRARELAWIFEYFRGRSAEPVVDEARIVRIHAALIDPAVATVTQLVERSGVSPRTVERVCLRDFGLPPKLLMRRQRFMRSLSRFMLHPSRNWIDAIDQQYHDQAQFVRDFRQFMGMTPRQYARLPHPVLDSFVRERSRWTGSAVQPPDSPAGVSIIGPSAFADGQGRRPLPFPALDLKA